MPHIMKHTTIPKLVLITPTEEENIPFDGFEDSCFGCLCFLFFLPAFFGAIFPRKNCVCSCIFSLSCVVGSCLSLCVASRQFFFPVFFPVFFFPFFFSNFFPIFFQFFSNF